MKRVAIIGTQGVPANYGGFETLVENIIGEHCSDNIEYTVYCSAKDMPQRLNEYKGAKLKYINWRANGVQSILYDIVAMIRSIRGYDTILVLGVSGCTFIPIFKLLSRAKVIVNIDGLEHRRDKWTRSIRKFLLLSEVAAVKNAHTIIADNKGIADYVTWRYKKDAKLIAYGGDHALRNVAQEKQNEILSTYGLVKDAYSISVCRIEPENNCHITIDAFAKSGKPLVFVGNWQRNEYSRGLKEKYGNCSNIKLIDSIYDLDILYTLRNNARCYIHGHSAGGTNPSLVEAMFLDRPILAYDVVYNRETTYQKAYYWQNSEQLQQLVERDDLTGNDTMLVAQQHYTWASISKQYEELY
ncbi:MAG: DUF1972 domain-containing protein [Bacteroidaceae bacterium]|nr:DUF1972 domain-containing protein [Bacteroidaceae bacterium]